MTFFKKIVTKKKAAHDTSGPGPGPGPAGPINAIYGMILG